MQAGNTNNQLSHGTETLPIYSNLPIAVSAPGVKVTADAIEAEYQFNETIVETVSGDNSIEGIIPSDDKNQSYLVARPVKHDLVLKTSRKVPRLGLMVVGLGGNNGTTLVACQMANQRKLSWQTRRGEVSANWYGSFTQCATVRLGTTSDGKEIYVPFKNLAPMASADDLVIGGWDISAMNMEDASYRARVLEPDLIRQVAGDLKEMVPLPAPYYAGFAAANQDDRADNVLPGGDKAKGAHLAQIRADIRQFKEANNLESICVMWSANTERFVDIIEGVNDTSENLLKAIEENHPEISPSIIFAVATILEDAIFINGSPQNTIVPGVLKLAKERGVFLMGNDFKSGQTRQKAVLADYLVGVGLKPLSIVSYNHLGNNDGYNLSAPAQFRSKEVSKASVVDDLVHSNGILYPRKESTTLTPVNADNAEENPQGPDHVVVIKYVPAVGDTKRAIDEYEAEILCGGIQTIAIHATCEDSLLAAPIILDLAILGEFFTRIKAFKKGDDTEHSMDTLLSLLAFFLKAPEVTEGSPLVNALFRQREAIINMARVAAGLSPDDHMNFQGRFNSSLKTAMGFKI